MVISVLGLAMMMASAAVVATAAPAQAATVALSTGTAVTYPIGCYDHPYTLDVSVPEGTDSWDLTVFLIDPTGLPDSRDYVYGFTDDPGPTNSTIQLCPSFDPPGRYGLRATLEYSDWMGTHTVQIPAISFTIRYPATRTSLAVSDKTPSVGQRVTFAIVSKLERPIGYIANKGAPVRLQRYVSGRWVVVASGRTSSTGRFTHSMTWRKSYAGNYRAYTPRGEEVGGSASSAIRVGPLPPPPPTLSLYLSPSSPIGGETARFYGKVSGGRRPVRIDRRAASGGTWTAVKTVTSTSTGAYSVSLATPKAKTLYRAYAPRTTRSPAVASATRTVYQQIQPVVVAPSKAVLGAPVTIAVDHEPTRVGRPLRIERWTGSAWTPIASGTANSQGRLTATVSRSSEGIEKYRGYAGAWRGAPAVYSPAKTITFAIATPAVSQLYFSSSSIGDARMSNDGRYIAYGADSGVAVYDRVTHETADPIGGQNINGFDLSGDGRYLAVSRGISDSNIYLVDRTTGAETLVSRQSGTTATETGQSSQPSISGNGQYVVYASGAANIVGEAEGDSDENGKLDIFVWDRSTGINRRVSHGSGGPTSGGSNAYSSIAEDGRYVAFDTNEPLADGDTDDDSDVYLWDRTNGSLTLVPSLALAMGHPVISGDGSTIVMDAFLGAPEPSSTADPSQLAVWDRATGQTAYVTDTGNGLANAESNFASVSDDGRFITYCTRADNIVPGDTADTPNVVQLHRPTGKTMMLSESAGIAPVMSGDGRFVIWSPAYSGPCYGGNLSSTTTLWDRFGQHW